MDDVITGAEHVMIFCNSASLVDMALIFGLSFRHILQFTLCICWHICDSEPNRLDVFLADRSVTFL